MKLIRAAVVLVVLLMFIGLERPAYAGTEYKDNPSGTGVIYTDYNPSPAPPMGQWQTFGVHIPNTDYDCITRGKWGNLPDHGFVQLQQIGGNHCHWGGISMWTLYHRPGYPDALVHTYTDPEAWCVGSPNPTNLPKCAQLSDGSIFMMRTTPPGTTDYIVKAEFITCAFSPGVFGPAGDKWQCDHYTYAINF